MDEDERGCQQCGTPISHTETLCRSCAYPDDAGAWVTCHECDGDGLVSDDDTRELVACDNCGGVGEVWEEYG